MNVLGFFLAMLYACAVIGAVATVITEGRNARWWVWAIAAPLILPFAIVVGPALFISTHGTKKPR